MALFILRLILHRAFGQHFIFLAALRKFDLKLPEIQLD